MKGLGLGSLYRRKRLSPHQTTALLQAVTGRSDVPPVDSPESGDRRTTGHDGNGTAGEKQRRAMTYMRGQHPGSFDAAATGEQPYTARMFMPPQASVPPSQTDPSKPAAGMFMAPLQGINGAEGRGNLNWSDLAMGVGMGLLSGDNWREGVALGLGNAQQLGMQRRQDERLDRRDAMDQARFDLQADQARFATEAAEREDAARQNWPQYVQSLDLEPQDTTRLSGMGYDAGMPIVSQMLAQSFTPQEPYSAFGKMQADVAAGRITPEQFDDWYRKETYIQPNQGAETWSQTTINGQPMLQSNRGDVKAMPGSGGAFDGNSMDAQTFNILLSAQSNPAILNTPEYAAAYAYQSQPKITMDPTTNKLVVVSPDLAWAKKPVQHSGEQGSGTPLPLMPQLGGNRPGPTVQNAQGAPTLPQQPAPAGIPGAETMQVPGATITSTPGTGLSAGDRSKLRDVKAQADSIRSALTRFKDVVKETGIVARGSALTGGLTESGRKLNSAWTNAAIMSKAEALFNLGVLNGPDLEVIQGTLPNPQTVMGAMASDEAYNAAIDEVLSLIDNKVAAYETQYGAGASTTATAPTMPGGGRRVDQLPAGNWTE